ncbi:MAG TPA: IS1380 family transposase [Actinomycetota bacterium]|nr:IS1380 family transposase [Actinomycetota bacterium]
MRSSHGLDRCEITFDDDRAVANAGVVLSTTLAERLGLERLIDNTVDLGDRIGAARPGRKVMTLVQSMVLGGDCIDDADVLRSGATEAVLAHRAMAPSTLGTFLRSFTFGHVRQLDKVTAVALARAWASGAGPGDAPMTIDVDSTVCEVHGYAKGGASYGHTRRLGYHPLLATRADTGEVLHVRQRTGKANTARGVVRFVSETVARVRRAGVGPLTVRADSGFHSDALIARCQGLGVAFSITVRQTSLVKEAIAAIPDEAWTTIDYTAGGEAHVGEGTYKGHRLVVRRTRLVGPQAELWPDWRYHAFVSDRVGEALDLDADHRRHAVIELAIRDLKEGSGLNHAPSGRFFANAAWVVLVTLAHNLLRWTAAIGLRIAGPVVAKTIRRRYLALPGRLTRSGRRLRLDLPRRWPWREAFLAAVDRLRALPLLA